MHEQAMLTEMDTRQKIIVLALITFIALGLFIPVAKAEAPILTKEEIADLKLHSWIDQLAFCESTNNEKAIHKNDGKDGTSSMGLLQFKLSTWRMYVKRYNLKYTDKDIWIGSKQKEVAFRMIKENERNKRQWLNCKKKIEGV